MRSTRATSGVVYAAKVRCARPRGARIARLKGDVGMRRKPIGARRRHLGSSEASQSMCESVPARSLRYQLLPFTARRGRDWIIGAETRDMIEPLVALGTRRA